jgi:hypothetical protein
MTALVDIEVIAEYAPSSATCGALDFITHARIRSRAHVSGSDLICSYPDKPFG